MDPLSDSSCFMTRFSKVALGTSRPDTPEGMRKNDIGGCVFIWTHISALKSTDNEVDLIALFLGRRE